MSRLALGTAQFGLDYGISNPGGRIGDSMVKSIIDMATMNGIDTYDTSPAYGTSEQVLGKLLPPGRKVVSKVPRIADEVIERKSLEVCGKAFGRSLETLGTESLYGLVVHWAEDLLKEGSDSLYGLMRELKEEGRVEKIGASVYSADQIDGILEKYDIDLIQAPLNILDQRLVHSGHLAMLKDLGVEIHVRSVFLQGLLLMESEAVPDYFTPYRDALANFQRHAQENGISPLQLSLGYVMGLKEVDKILVGVNTAAQLEEIIHASRIELDAGDFKDLASDEPGFLNPSMWKI